MGALGLAERAQDDLERLRLVLAALGDGQLLDEVLAAARVSG